MGNQESKGTDFINSFSRNYKFEKDINDSRLGEVKIYQSQLDDKESVAVKVYPRLQQVNQLSTFTAFMNYNGNFIGTNQNEHPNLIKLYALKTNQEQELTIYYEYCYTNVKDQIDMRNTHGYHFSAEELWRTILSVIMAGHFLESQNRYIGDVNTKRIFINKKGIIKLAPYMQAQSDMDSFKRAGFLNEYGYLAPECLEKFKQGDILSQINFNKNDAFGLGMSILEMATLKSSSELYDWNTYEIKYALFEERLEETRMRFGEYLHQFLKKLINKEISQRFTFSQLFQELLPYQQAIITGIGFSDISIFKATNGQFDSIIRKLEGYSMHSKQDSQTSTQFNQITKVSNLPSIYSSSDQNKSTLYQQQFSTKPIVQINLSPTNNISQSKKIVSQPTTNHQLQDKDYIKFNTEESDTTINNNGQIHFYVSPKYQSNNSKSSQYGMNSTNVSASLSQNMQHPPFMSIDGSNLGRDNTFMYRICNVNKPLSPDQRSLSPSPVLHSQVPNLFKLASPQLCSHQQQNHIQMKGELDFAKKAPLHPKQVAENLTDRLKLNQNNNFNYQELKKPSVPIKKICLNNYPNQNTSVRTITTQQNPLDKIINVKNTSQHSQQNTISNENVFTGNIIYQQQPLEKNYLTTNHTKDPVKQIQINIPVHRTNRNMIISPMPHHNRSVSPSHYMVQRSITPTMRTQFNNQLLLLSPSGQNKLVHPMQQKLNNTIANDSIYQTANQFQYIDKSNINNSINEGPISQMFAIPQNSISHHHGNGGLQINTDRVYTQHSIGDHRLQVLLQNQY